MEKIEKEKVNKRVIKMTKAATRRRQAMKEPKRNATRMKSRLGTIWRKEVKEN